ncbi:iron-containing redox enzyme family protein [Pseudoalteromonas piscicida]|uniref:iron-containing redox enzyme family protein n=1 Tax=Pseudoalteromonas piscicida TaxID=43662 RepID=UPI001EFDE030|nr:iron-containing redox enzyme family protein [Pseudoalteromonas piscicida]MCG9771414.1 iron-containing redox enzyme family protein [Pseudoalteromonas piscicida]
MDAVTKELKKATEPKALPKKLTSDTEYDYADPEVIHWTSYFMDEANKQNVFVNINATADARMSKATAICMAKIWYEFTRFVPIFITKAVTLTDDPERQHALIQIAYDELGGRDKNFIHSQLFIDTLREIDITVDDSFTNTSITSVLNHLDNTLTSTNSQYGIVGLLMSFEIIAEENIETLFKCLCYDEHCDPAMSKTPFFKIHRQDETEHIRHSVANYLRFCKTEQQKREFKASFDAGVNFWQRFWDQTSRTILLESEQRQTA